MCVYYIYTNNNDEVAGKLLLCFTPYPRRVHEMKSLVYDTRRRSGRVALAISVVTMQLQSALCAMILWLLLLLLLLLLLYASTCQYTRLSRVTAVQYTHRRRNRRAYGFRLICNGNAHGIKWTGRAIAAISSNGESNVIHDIRISNPMILYFILTVIARYEHFVCVWVCECVCVF